MKYMIFPIVIMLSGLTACNTIARGTTDYLRIDTVPQGARVMTTIETYESQKKTEIKLNANKEYRSCAPTPCLLEVGRRQGFAIKIEHEGYEPAEIAINGEIPMRSANLDMAVPAGSIAANVGLGAASGALVGSISVAFSQMWYNIFTLGSVQAPTSGVVAGATATGAGIGLGMVGVDLLSGSYENIYPNPIVVKLARKGTPTLTDPNMLMFNLRQAKKREARKYCKKGRSVSENQRRKQCKQARELDKQRDIENAELLASEQKIKNLVKEIKQQIQEARAKTKKQKISKI